MYALMQKVLGLPNIQMKLSQVLYSVARDSSVTITHLSRPRFNLMQSRSLYIEMLAYINDYFQQLCSNCEPLSWIIPSSSYSLSFSKGTLYVLINERTVK